MAPVLLFALLVAGEAGLLLSQKAAQDRATATIAAYAASRPGDESWHAVANRELPGCDVTVDEPLPGVLEATATCTYTGRLVSGFVVPVSSRESAASSRPAPEPTPTPEPSGSVEP